MKIKSENFYNFRHLFYALLRKKQSKFTRKEREVMDLFCFKIYITLLKEYSKRSRKCYNTIYINSCLKELRKIKHLVKYPEEMGIAIWFHRVSNSRINTTDRSTEKSAVMFETLLGKCFDQNTLYRVKMLILATKEVWNAEELSRLPKALAHDCALMHDLSKNNLGKSYIRFEEFMLNKRRESWFIPYFIYKKTEIRLLKAMSIAGYKTAYFKSKYEIALTKNITNYIRGIYAKSI